jgi:hypothetical protein
MVTDAVAESLGERGLSCAAIGEVSLKGFPEPTELYLVRPANE